MYVSKNRCNPHTQMHRHGEATQTSGITLSESCTDDVCVTFA